jgi:hypothetical protein
MGGYIELAIHGPLWAVHRPYGPLTHIYTNNMDTKIDVALFAIESDCVQKVPKNYACADLICKAFFCLIW